MPRLKNGDLVEVSRIFPIAENADVSDYLKRAIRNTADQGFCNPDTEWNDNETGAILMRKDGNLIGILAYRNTPILFDGEKLLQILLGEVSKDYRSQGAYSILHRELETFAKENEFGGILSYVRTKNQRMMSTLRALKKQIVTVTCYKKI